MHQELQANQNGHALKSTIQTLTHVIEQKVYWFMTAEEEGQFLQQYWGKHVSASQTLKNRLARITEQKLDELLTEVKHSNIQSHAANLQTSRIDHAKLRQIAEDMIVLQADYFSQNHPKTKQAKLKVKQINEDFAQFKSQMRRIQQKQQTRKLQCKELREQIEKERSEEKKRADRQHALKTIEYNKKKKEQRKKENAKFQQFLRNYKNSKPLHQLMEEEYEQKLELPIIQENNRKLERIGKVKPTLEQINEHEKRYMQDRQSRQQVLVSQHPINVSFKSKFYREEQGKLGTKQYEYFVDQVEKKKRYSELVKQNFKPRVSQALRKSVAQNFVNQSSAMEVPDRSIVLAKGKAYLEFMRSLDKNRHHSSPDSEKSQSPVYCSRYKDYLEQLRKITPKTTRVSHDWDRELQNKDLSSIQKRNRVLMKSKLLEEQAQQEEKYVRNCNRQAVELIDRKRQIDEKLVDSIRAKMAVLRVVQSAQGQ